jgi:hypothetical protein
LALQREVTGYGRVEEDGNRNENTWQNWLKRENTELYTYMRTVQNPLWHSHSYRRLLRRWTIPYPRPLYLYTHSRSDVPRVISGCATPQMTSGNPNFPPNLDIQPLGSEGWQQYEAIQRYGIAGRVWHVRLEAQLILGRRPNC